MGEIDLDSTEDLTVAIVEMEQALVVIRKMQESLSTAREADQQAALRAIVQTFGSEKLNARGRFDFDELELHLKLARGAINRYARNLYVALFVR